MDSNVTHYGSNVTQKKDTMAMLLVMDNITGYGSNVTHYRPNVTQKMGNMLRGSL